LAYSTIAVVGLGSIALGSVSEGLRWQMIPAYVGFAALMIASLKKSNTKSVWRTRRRRVVFGHPGNRHPAFNRCAASD
jgi:hypothetical protein